MPPFRLDRNITIVVVTAILCITALLWGLFIWPTPYTYEKVSRPWYQGTKQEVYRVNRFTGDATKVVDPCPRSQ